MVEMSGESRRRTRDRGNQIGAVLLDRVVLRSPHTAHGNVRQLSNLNPSQLAMYHVPTLLPSDLSQLGRRTLTLICAQQCASAHNTSSSALAHGGKIG